MAEHDTELRDQISQRGKTGLSKEGKAVREAVRSGAVPDPEEQKRAHRQSGYRLPDSFYRLDPELEAHKQPGNERGLSKGNLRDEPDKKDPATKAAIEATKQAPAIRREQEERRAAAREAAETPAATSTSGVTVRAPAARRPRSRPAKS
jgi:hypothetical protein